MHVEALLELMTRGQVVEAMETWYDRNVSIRENAHPPCIGLDKNLRRIRDFMADVAEWTRFEVVAWAADDRVALIEYEFEFVTREGTAHRYDQVSSQTWEQGKVVAERFYYDPEAH